LVFFDGQNKQSLAKAQRRKENRKAFVFDKPGVLCLPEQWTTVLPTLPASLEDSRMSKSQTCLGSIALLLLSCTLDFAGVIGPELIQRSQVDTASGYETLYQGFFPTVGEQVVSLQIFNDNTANTNWITPLILSFQGGRVWQITGVGLSEQNTGTGLQTYAFGLQSGSDLIAASNYTFGWWNGRVSGTTFTGNTGVIMFDTTDSTPGFGESCPTPDCPVSNLGFAPPAVGMSYTFANNFSGPNPGTLGNGFGRVYSVQFTTAPVSSVPEHSTFSFLAFGLLVATWARHKRIPGRVSDSRPERITNR
jgi:hypothetical protein